MNNKARGIEIGGRIYYFQDESQKELIETVSGDVQTISGDLITLSQEVDNKASQSDFEAFSGEVSSELSGKATQASVDALNDIVTAHTNNVDAHVTSEEKEYWNTQIQALWEAISGTPVPPTPPTPTTEYRWVVVDDAYECSGTTKMTQEKEQFSTDSGATWNDVVPLTTRAALPVIEYNSEDCGYVPPTFDGKFKLTLNDSSTVSAECDSTNQIRYSEVSAYTGSVVSAEIGQCVTSIGNSAFYNCTSLTSIDIPDSVTTIDYNAFCNCYSLSTVTIPDSVTTIGQGAFQICSGLTSINIPSGVTSIGEYAFNWCTRLTSIDIPSGVTSIGAHSFLYCSVLTSITVNAVTPPSLGLSAFDDTNNCPIYVPSESVETYKTATNWSTYANRIQAIP